MQAFVAISRKEKMRYLTAMSAAASLFVLASCAADAPNNADGNPNKEAAPSTTMRPPEPAPQPRNINLEAAVGRPELSVLAQALNPSQRGWVKFSGPFPSNHWDTMGWDTCA